MRASGASGRVSADQPGDRDAHLSALYLAGPGVAVDRNAGRVLASIKMLEINVTDLLLWVSKQGLTGRIYLPDAKHL